MRYILIFILIIGYSKKLTGQISEADFKNYFFENNYDFVTVIPKMSRNAHLRILLETYKIPENIEEHRYNLIKFIKALVLPTVF